MLGTRRDRFLSGLKLQLIEGLTHSKDESVAVKLARRANSVAL